MKNGLSCREAFTAELARLGRENRDILVVTSDAKGSTAAGVFTDSLPEQYIEIGIAEQNEIGVAAGLAAVGKKPYVCAPASFLSARSLEQIKVDVAYSHMNVKILAVSGGISYGALGFSHHSTHDVAVMRCFPGLRVILPCDETQTVALLREMNQADYPAYVRVGKQAMPLVYEPGTEFKVGVASRPREGRDMTIIACGEMVWRAVEAADLLARDGLSVRVLDMHTLHPLDEAAILTAARETGRILTVEEHSVNGGLGAAVASLTATHQPIPMRILALPDEDLIAGASPEVFEYYGLGVSGICKTARELAAVKK